ncbi:MAG: hypothetical protein KR126chlam3_01413 [Chlamydiae bacterium]|nr:hypothetical protein [Chlamydiota bacterium]
MVPRSLGTHDGSFHADEVSAVSLLLIFDLIDKDKIFRMRDPQKLGECEFVCDVGGVYDPETKRFDHHQQEYTGLLSSAGMVWRYLHENKFVDDSLYTYVNHAAIIGIDAHDNGKVMQQEGVCTFSHVIAGYVPVEYAAKETELTAAFLGALDFATHFFQRLLARHAYIESCRDKVAAVMVKKEKVLIFDEALPWQENFFDLGGKDHPALFIIMPTGVHWKLRGIPPNQEDRMGVRKPHPEEWAGLRDAALQKITGIPGAIFCHKGRFISIWETKEDARKALDLILKK